jgi:hypothetical protein
MLAQAQLNESPITPGFWSFPGRKAVTAQEIRAACRNHFEIRFGDGHFIGLTMHKTETNFTQRLVEDVGRCMFNRETQIDHCEKKLFHSDGSMMVGTTENQYSFDSDKTVKVIVTPKMITDQRCPIRCLSGALSRCHHVEHLERIRLAKVMPKRDLARGETVVAVSHGSERKLLGQVDNFAIELTCHRLID